MAGVSEGTGGVVMGGGGVSFRGFRSQGWPREKPARGIGLQPAPSASLVWAEPADSDSGTLTGVGRPDQRGAGPGLAGCLRWGARWGCPLSPRNYFVASQISKREQFGPKLTRAAPGPPRHTREHTSVGAPLGAAPHRAAQSPRDRGAAAAGQSVFRLRAAAHAAGPPALRSGAAATALLRNRISFTSRRIRISFCAREHAPESRLPPGPSGQRRRLRRSGALRALPKINRLNPRPEPTESGAPRRRTPSQTAAPRCPRAPLGLTLMRASPSAS